MIQHDTHSFYLQGTNGRGVILVHGLTGAPAEMKFVGKQLHKAGFTVYAPTLAGHCVDEAALLATSYEDWVASLHRAIEEFSTQVDEVYMAGICVGGALALTAAQWPGAKVRGVAIYSPLLNYDGWSTPFYYRLLKYVRHILVRIPAVRRISFKEHPPYGIKSDRVRNAVMNGGAGIEGTLPSFPGLALYQNYRLNAALVKMLPRITTPTLLIHAREDDVGHPRNAYKIQRLHGGDCRVEILEDSYHMIHVDQERKKVAQLTAEFFDGLRAQAAPLASSPPEGEREQRGLLESPLLFRGGYDAGGSSPHRRPQEGVDSPSRGELASLTAGAKTLPTITLHRSITEIGKAAWDACFLGALEGYDYLLAAETAGIQGFDWRYLVARCDGQVIAAVPAFFTRYHLDTTLDGAARRFVARIKRLFPRFLSLKLACIGSPVMEFGEVGFHPSVEGAVVPPPIGGRLGGGLTQTPHSMAAPLPASPRWGEEKATILTYMLTHFERQAAAEGYRLIGVKDYVADAQWQTALKDYPSVSGLPIAHLAIDFADMETYFARLSHATRKDMRRKLRHRDAVRIEFRTNVDDVLPRMMELYRDTHARAEMQFEELTPEFFRNVLAMNAGRALCVLYYVGESLLAFNLLLRDGQTLLDKYFCMDSVHGREFNLYFLSWFTNVEYCLQHGLTQFQSGAAGYDSKLRLGCTLMPTRMAFRHRNPLMHRLLRLAAPLLEPELPVEVGA